MACCQKRWQEILHRGALLNNSEYSKHILIRYCKVIFVEFQPLEAGFELLRQYGVLCTYFYVSCVEYILVHVSTST